MEKGVIRDFIVIILLFSSHLLWSQAGTISGLVVDTSDQPIGQLKLQVDNYEPITSNTDGTFEISDFEINREPSKVTISKKGYEVSTFSYLNKSLTVYVRKATFKTISGVLTDLSGSKQPNRSFVYQGTKEQTIVSNQHGQFSFKIPYEEAYPSDAAFLYDGRPATVIKRELNGDKNQLTLTLSADIGVAKVYTVELKKGKGEYIKNAMVQIDEQIFMTEANGQFKMSALGNANAKWKVDSYIIQSIDTIAGKNKIVVLLKGTDIPLAGPSIVPDPEAEPPTPKDELSHGIDHMNSFFVEQEEKLREQNKKIQDIHTLLPNISEFDESDHEVLVQQLRELTSSIESTTRAFNETKQVNMNFVNDLQSKLDEKDQTIQDINEEKVLMTNKFKTNLTFVLLVLLGITILLGIALWMNKRFKIQNRVIKRTKKELLKVQEMAKIGSMHYDPRTKMFDYSDNFFRTLRITQSDRIKKLNAKKIDGVIHEELVAEVDRDKVQVLWQEGLEKEKQINVEFQGKSEDDSPLYIDMNARFERDASNTVTYISSSLQDVSEKKKHEIRLMSAMEEAGKASKVKEEFLAAMSHEIRTPLNAIIGLTDQLIAQNPKKSQQQNLDIIQISSEHLLSLLNDVLDFSKIKAGKIKFDQKELLLKETVTNTVKSMSVSANNKGIKLETNFHDNLPHRIVTDKLRLNQILINLVNNAIKFTDKGSVKVSVRPLSQERGQARIRFSVIDTGVGIADNKLDKIFESFEQEDETTARKFGGTGLGLAICKQLVGLMGGELNVKSKLDEGSEFYFEADYQVASTADVNAGEEEVIPNSVGVLEGLKVLCVEDNEINQLVISQYFNNWKMNVTFAGTGKEAIKLYAQDEFQIVFMDIRLPDMTGYEITEKIRADFPNRNEPIVAFTAEMDESTERKIKEVGMVAYLSKPFKSEDLFSTILENIKTP